MDQKKNGYPPPEKQTIEVLREEVDISREKFVTGTVTAHKTVGTEMEHHRISLMREEIDVRHVHINKKIDSMPETRVEANVTIIPIVREVAVVNKILMLMEEVHITKRTSSPLEDIAVSIRKETVEIKGQDN